MVIGFEQGVPVSLDGERLGLVELLERAGEIGARHGAGIVDHIEDRIVGLKVRDLYEVPAAALILTAHKELEKLVGTIHQNTFKPQLDAHWAYLVYAGLWYEPLLGDLNALMDSVNEQVTGEITMRLYKGSARAVARRSPNALYDPALAGFGESGGLFSQQASPGFIELWSLQSRMAYNVRNRGKRQSHEPKELHRPWLDRVAGRVSGRQAQDVAEQGRRSARAPPCCWCWSRASSPRGPPASDDDES